LRTPTEAALIRYCFQPRDETLPAPNLNVVAVNHALRLGNGLAVVATNQGVKAYEVPVTPNDIGPVLCHPNLLQGPQAAVRRR
jgi:hypothetical protein